MRHQHWLVLTLAVIFTFAAVNAQTTGTVSGVVQDETGGVIPGAEVTAVNTGTSATRTVISDDAGRYRIPQLAPGSYELRAELSGFQTAVLQDISLSMAQEAVVGITLRVGAISEQVVVSAEVSLVDTRSATVAALVDSQQIRDLAPERTGLHPAGCPAGGRGGARVPTPNGQWGSGHQDLHWWSTPL